MLGLLCGLVLSGCSSNVWEEIGDLFRTSSSAEAQDDNRRRIQTFQIEPGSLELKTDDLPNIVVDDSATVYTLASDADINFTIAGGDPIEHNLDSGDQVIERPASNTVTLDRRR